MTPAPFPKAIFPMKLQESHEKFPNKKIAALSWNTKFPELKINLPIKLTFTKEFHSISADIAPACIPQLLRNRVS